MIHKKTMVAVLVVAVLAGMLLSGCRHYTVPVDRDDVRVWLAREPDSCLWHVTGLYVPLLKEKKYREMEQLYAGVLRAMPLRPEGGKDLNYLTGWVLTYYYNALMLQDKVDGSEHLTDSLLRSTHPYYRDTMRPELLVASAKFYVAQSRQERVDSIGRLFLALPSTGDPRRDASTWYNMAWTLQFGDIDTKLPQRLMEQAVEACRKAQGKVGNEGEIYDYAGYLCWKNGELEKATHYIQQAVDWYTARPGTPGDGLISTYMDLARVYVSLGLYDKALEANRACIRCSRAADNWMLEEVYRMHAAYFHEAGQPDSSLYYIQKSMEAMPQSAEKYYLQRLQIERLGHYYAAFPDSIGSQLDECRRLLKDTARTDAEPRANLLAYYGMALLHTPGREAEGVDYIERGFRLFRDGHYPEGVVHTGHRLINAYIRTGMTERIASVYPVYIGTRDSLEARKKVNAAIGANIRYETGRKEQENRALAAEVALKHRTLVFTWVLTGLLAVLLVGGGWYLRQRHRYLRRVSDARLSRISGLLRVQRELSRHNASLAHELHATSDELEKTSRELSEVSSRLDTVSKQKATSGIRVKVSEKLLHSDKAAEFRRSFAATYPDYLPSLRRLSPDLTPTDELIAMLLMLGESNQDIALTLGISRTGVNKARSRLRKRLGLKSEVVLEEFLKGISG